MASIYGMIVSAFQKDADGAAAVTAVAKKVIHRAYKSGDTVEIQLMLDHMTKSYREALPRFFKRAGFAITMEPGKPAMVGLLDKSQQAKVFEWLAEPSTVVIDVENVIKRPRDKNENTATWAEQADQRIRALVARAKKDAPEVAGIINQRLNRPAWAIKLEAIDPTPEELQAAVELILAARMEEAMAKAA